MVARSAPLPNLRKFFVPDPGMEMLSADLAGADARVVAWEADDEDLKDAFKSGLKIHLKNARDIFPEETKGISDEGIKATDYPGGIYHDCKTAVHATNYGARAKTVAMHCGWTVKEADRFQKTWFSLHVGILRWHNRVNRELQSTRTVSNRFGYRIVYFDRVEKLLPEALAWVPQSTVALNCSFGALAVEENLPYVELLSQVHDEVVMQYPISWGTNPNLQLLKDTLRVLIPYEDPLVIPWTFKRSRRSWGECA